MDIQNPPNPNQTVAQSATVFPTLPKSESSQILTHPDHILGKLPLPQQNSVPKQHRSVGKIFAGVSAILIIFFLIVTFTFFIPRTVNFKFAKQSQDATLASSKKIDAVNKSLEVLYQARSNTQTQDGVTVSKNTVLGVATTSMDTTFFSGALLYVEKISDISDTSSKIKAFSVPGNDPTSILRKHRQLAQEIDQKASVAEKTLSSIEEVQRTNNTNNESGLGNKLKDLVTKTKNYIDQAKKTSAYYTDLSDASVDLYNLIATTYTIKDYDNDISKLTALKSKFSNYKDLPDQMTAYNNDLVSLYGLLNNLITSEKAYLNGKAIDIKKIESEASFEIESIKNRAVIDEISFWQNNKSLANYDTLAQDHQDVIDTAESMKESNNFFLISWLGL